MKINSMEASNSSIVKGPVKNEAMLPKRVPAPETTTIKASEEVRNISNLTEFDRLEMPISEKVVIDAIERANKAISGASRRFEFTIHEETKEIMVKVINSDTNEVIREIPNEKILDMVARMWEMAGIIVDERR